MHSLPALLSDICFRCLVNVPTAGRQAGSGVGGQCRDSRDDWCDVTAASVLLLELETKCLEQVFVMDRV